MKKHNTALDGLRWFAFLGVFLFHANSSLFYFGSYGVQVFFVLSGFLIGGILLSQREQATIPLWDRLRTFYIRRSLRIFPVYYFLLLSLFVLGILHLQNSDRLYLLSYHALYLTNFYLFFTGAQIDSQTHLWTLCVEEHFYLLIPLVLLSVSLKNLARGTVALLVLVTACRLLNAVWWHQPRLEYLSFMQFDVMMVGVITAIVQRNGSFLGVTAPRLLRAGTVCGAASLIIMVAYAFSLPFTLFLKEVVLPLTLSIGVAALLLSLWNDRMPALQRFLSWKPFVFLGQISYGLYLYHNFLFVLSRSSTGGMHFVMTGAVLIATIIIATASWFLLENPVNELKRFFPYQKPKPPVDAPA
ncbi:MAG: acyltransferase [Armatimonadetes bacterium]|nr:acyltransferase [Armatimonadota bacterium]